VGGLDFLFLFFLASDVAAAGPLWAAMRAAVDDLVGCSLVEGVRDIVLSDFS
jgi:hypothetical protein